MATRRKAVPTQLHSELSEYSSLLRALRTSSTLDLSSHLATSSQLVSHTSDESDDEDAQTSQFDATTDNPGALDGPPSTNNSKATAKKKPRDTWTRWPLLAGDVLIPEWGLEDEIQLIALQTMSSYYDGGDDDTNFQASTWIDSLTQVASHHLSRILALIAAHIPASDKSLQNRVNPIGWETVIDILAAYGSEFVDEQTVARVTQRLESLYAPSRSVASERVSKRDAAVRRLEDAFLPYRDDFLKLAPQPLLDSSAAPDNDANKYVTRALAKLKQASNPQPPAAPIAKVKKKTKKRKQALKDLNQVSADNEEAGPSVRETRASKKRRLTAAPSAASTVDPKASTSTLIDDILGEDTPSGQDTDTPGITEVVSPDDPPAPAERKKKSSRKRKRP